MKWLTFKIQKEPGARFNLIDAILISAIIAVTFYASKYFGQNHYYLIPAYVGATFFLFCNVFRIGNNKEPIWYFTFVALTLYYFGRPDLYWPRILMVCEPLKAALIGYMILRGEYRGIFFEQIRGLRGDKGENA